MATKKTTTPTTKKTATTKNSKAALKAKTAAAIAEAAIKRNRNKNVPVCSCKKLTTKCGVGRILDYIAKHPNQKPGEINEALGYKSHRSNLWSTLRWGGLVLSEHTHYVVSTLGRKLLVEAGIIKK